VLLIKGEHLKLLGIAGQMMGIASISPNILAKIYTVIYIAAANERIYRRGEAVEAIRQALDMGIPDKVYMPFVENCDYIKPLLEELHARGIYCKDIAKILGLYKPYQKSMEQIKGEYFTKNKPKLTGRETEIAQLAAEGFSNKVIGERLFISPNTVKTQLKSVFDKLGVNSRFLLKQYFETNS
jgi:LuxR family transcriptional regulator, maltose regulon positive regulatory protein